MLCSSLGGGLAEIWKETLMAMKSFFDSTLHLNVTWVSEGSYEKRSVLDRSP